MRKAQFVCILAFFAAVLPVSAGAPVVLQPKMGDPLLGLTPAQLTRFNEGKVKFTHVFQDSEGLGPTFNQNACSSCHNNPIGGSGTIMVTRFGTTNEKGDEFDPLASLGGSLLQNQSISKECAEEIPPEATITTQRATPSVLGFGLVEAIPDADIEANATNPPSSVSGQVHLVSALEDLGGPLHVGRFGWKDQLATVLSFSGDASLNEIGITNRLVPMENAPNGDLDKLAECDTVADPEDGPEGGIRGNPHFIDRITDFQRFLAPPPQTPRSGMTGEALFASIGCTDCHMPSFTTSPTFAEEEALQGVTIKPYSDFLLHDVGLNADFVAQGNAGQREIRTPLLWGLRVRDPMWHDGRVAGGSFADRVLAVIPLHDVLLNEARDSAEAFGNLGPSQQTAILAFLDSLGRREFDHDGDNDVDVNDLLVILDCYTGPGSFYTPDDACSISDVDQDGDVDDDDINLFLTVYTGPQGDCNNNSVNDVLDLIHQTSKDCNGNGIPDECDPESSNVALFVGQLLLNSQSPLLVCMLDQDGNTVLNGNDIQPFVMGLLNP